MRRRGDALAVRIGDRRRERGEDRGTRDRHATGLTGHTVVHLHGGLTPASYDGWTENLSAPGQTAVFHYPGERTRRMPGAVTSPILGVVDLPGLLLCASGARAPTWSVST